MAFSGSNQFVEQVRENPPQMQAEGELAAELRRIGAKNIHDPLPPAPCLKEILTGIIHTWTPSLAARPDLVVCCDENGNEDVSSWWGRTSRMVRPNGTVVAPDELPPMINKLPDPAPAEARSMPVTNPSYIRKQTPEVSTAPELLGVPEDFTQDYRAPSRRDEIRLFAGIEDYTIEDLVATVQKEHIDK